MDTIGHVCMDVNIQFTLLSVVISNLIIHNFSKWINIVEGREGVSPILFHTRPLIDSVCVCSCFTCLTFSREVMSFPPEAKMSDISAITGTSSVGAVGQS